MLPRAAVRQTATTSAFAATVTAVHATATISASALTAHCGRPCDHHGFGQCGDCSSRASVQPPRCRPVLLLRITAGHPTTTTPACAATAHHGRLCNHHGFGRCEDGAGQHSALNPAQAMRLTAA